MMINEQRVPSMALVEMDGRSSDVVENGATLRWAEGPGRWNHGTWTGRVAQDAHNPMLELVEVDIQDDGVYWMWASAVEPADVPQCDQCVEISIQGQRCHETGCPNG